MPIEIPRPDPDALLERVLADEKKDTRGKLKIFFGGCAGVGKTYAMLAAAREKLNEGLDVLVGLVETHRREETEKLLQGLPMLPPRTIEHRGVAIYEFDIDAAIARKPSLILIDELAHTNAPGSRHPKRWQDVEELLDEGIDVYTTLNVQHLESLNDVVAGITGVWVKETVSDAVFDSADEIVLVDITTDELLKRLKEGKVYIAPQTRRRAAQHFFKKTNLIALRELALRRTAERVDAQMNSYRAQQGITDAQAVADRILVCVGPDPLSNKVVRAAKRMATALKTPWSAIYIENSRHYRMSEKARQNVEATLKLAERMGAKTVVIQGNNAIDEIISYARSHGFTKIIAGKQDKARWKDYIYGSLVDKLIRKSGDIDVYVITGTSSPAPFRRFSLRAITPRRVLLYVYAIFSVLLCTAIGWLLQPFMEEADLIMVLLIGVVSVAAQCGRGPSILASLMSVGLFNLLFVTQAEQKDGSYLMTLAVMLVTAFIISSQASKLRLQAVYSRKRERETQSLYAITKSLSATRGHKSISEIAATHIAENFDADVTIWMPGLYGLLEPIHGSLTDEEVLKEETVARWTFEHGHPAGLGTSTLPTAKGFYVPLVSNNRTLGVLGLTPRAQAQPFTTEKVSVTETYAGLLATALERANTADEAEQLKIQAETDKLRNILLSSISHDLHMPLDAIIDISHGLMTDDNRFTKDGRLEQLQLINREAERLSRLVSNVLEATSLESGNTRLHLEPHPVEGILHNALRRNEPLLNLHEIKLDIAETVGMVLVDTTLLEQVFNNLLENAAKYAPPHSVVTVSAHAVGHEARIRIADQGPGIPAGEEKRIFEKFFSTPRSGMPKSSGLGLAICKRIMDVHGGRIWAENQPGGGAVFTCSLPLEGAMQRDLVLEDEPE